MSSTIKLGSSREFALLHQYMFYKHLNFTNSKDIYLSTKYLWFLTIQTVQDTHKEIALHIFFLLLVILWPCQLLRASLMFPASPTKSQIDLGAYTKSSICINNAIIALLHFINHPILILWVISSSTVPFSYSQDLNYCIYAP